MNEVMTVPNGRPVAAALPAERRVGDYVVRLATPADLHGARKVMLDTFYREFGHGYVADWHHDVIDLAGTYLATPGHALLVAATVPYPGGDEQVVATAAVRAHGPRHPPHPQWLVERYPDGSTAQLFRVYVHAEHRRRGLARALVRRAVEVVTAQPRYQRLYLHTDARVPGAEAFWRSVATPVWDARDGVADRPQTIHFEIPLPGRCGPA
ncbi:GNAT family N-acetyltransferase [Natronosporangium hydrolyticum]|uniref:GNAT family N-acetyltransferase n=1 Tax=Natronosporangium hydrolyticum TaxID=2811111 RepID=A0A895YA19_9ACTN|nr:GNAT family N-acetyltransferase [Natronosporangium hydrolyticum]QSB14614.1 GNAT family N-acetyltransferase [Natronosporangium hydrolyticum]